VLKERVGVQDTIVWLNNRGANLRRWVHSEPKLGLLSREQLRGRELMAEPELVPPPIAFEDKQVHLSASFLTRSRHISNNLPSCSGWKSCR
jgi:hypothetical protein